MTIMKKQYISPELFIEYAELENIICNSITGVDGVDDIGIDSEDKTGAPVSGDARFHDIWFDEKDGMEEF